MLLPLRATPCGAASRERGILAFSWIAKEHGTHHVAMPATILLAMLTVSIFLGWYREAGIFSLAWGGLLRIGEATALLRADLVLPVDMFHAQCHILVRIEEPKTRLRAARPQAAKIEQIDLGQLISPVFEDLPRSSRLWPQSTGKRRVAILNSVSLGSNQAKEAKSTMYGKRFIPWKNAR